MFKFKHACTPPGTQKHKGSIALFLIAILFVVSVICASLTTIAQATFSTSSSSKIALQAQQYADAKAEILKATKYENITAHERSIIDNSIYQDEVLVDSEKPYPGNEDILQKECTINVYRLNEEYPRYSLRVVRTSVSTDNSLPIGSIIPYKGDLKDIPDSWAVCDGSNGTPDLRDRFITGAGITYEIGDTGGQNKVLLEADETTSHYHGVGDYYQGNNNGAFIGINRNETFILPPGGGTIGWNGSNHGGWFKTAATLIGEQVTSLAIGVDATKPHENRPPYYALFYIMKIK